MAKIKAGLHCVGTVLTEKEYETLKSMIKSSDPGDHLVAQQLLTGCDIQQSIYWIWKLAKHGSYNMVNLRTLAGRQFKEATSLFGLDRQNEEQFAYWLIAKGWMTVEIFQRLKQGIKDLIKNRAQNDLFCVHVSIKGSFRYLDPENVHKTIIT